MTSSEIIKVLRDCGKQFPDEDWFGIYEFAGIAGVEKHYDYLQQLKFAESGDSNQI